MAKAKKTTSTSKKTTAQETWTIPATDQPVIDQTKPYEETHYIDTTKPVWNYSLLTDEDVSNYQDGTHYQLYKKFGSHSIQVNDT